MFKLGIFTLTLLWTTVAVCKPLKKAELIKRIDEIVKYQARRLNVPGGAFGLVIDGEVALKNVAGPRGLGREAKVNYQTLFQIASISKPFTAAVALKTVKFDQPIKPFLPNRCKTNECDGINVSHLLNHTSGISTVGMNEMIENGDEYEGIVSKALSAKRACKPGKCFQYNNVAYELVREIIEKVESRPYIDSLRSEVLSPLKMTNTSTSYEELKRGNNYFVPHLLVKGQFKETTHSTAYYAFPGAGGLNSDLDDMTKFVVAELGKDFAALHKPTTVAPDAEEWIDEGRVGKGMVSHYAYGHRLLQFPDLTVVFHSGWVKGSKSMMAIFPAQKMGFILLQNSESMLGFRVLEDVIHLLRN